MGLAIGLITPGVQADMFTLSTRDSEFDAGVSNQGWWASNQLGADSNSNYLVGQSGSTVRRNFFSFDFSGTLIPADHAVTSATLNLRRGSSSSGNEATETLEFFQVTNTAASINNNQGPNGAIFNDLGSGTTYGSFDVAGSGGSIDILSFNLNASALSDINGGLSGFFSIGGGLTSQDGNDEMFGGTSGGFGNSDSIFYAATLDVVTAPVAVPVPGAALLAMIGMPVVAWAKRRFA